MGEVKIGGRVTEDSKYTDMAQCLTSKEIRNLERYD